MTDVAPMGSRQATDRSARLASHPVHRIPPVGDPYVLGRWHPDRASWKGYAFEARILAKSLIRRSDPQRFLILSRPRSGSTLLVRLLTQVEGIQCDGEVLHHAVLSPRGFLNRLASTRTSRSWGCKIISYQMFEVQRIRDHRAFLEGLLSDGFRLIHMRRRTYDQALSLLIAQTVRQYHIRPEGTVTRPEVSLDPARFVDQVRWNLAMLDYETQLLQDLPFIEIDYDADLKDQGRHQATVDRICARLGLASGPVNTNLRRAAELRRIGNLDDLHRALRQAGLGHVLDDPSS